MIKKLMDLEKVYKIDIVIVVLTIISLVAVGGFVQPLVIAPLNDFETTETRILFSIEKAERILIDDNLEFSTAEEYIVTDGLKIDLSPGIYYWKAGGITESEVRTLTIKSEVNLELKENGDLYSVINSGNVPLNVEIYDESGEFIENVRLNIHEETQGSKFIGSPLGVPQSEEAGAV